MGSSHSHVETHTSPSGDPVASSLDTRIVLWSLRARTQYWTPSRPTRCAQLACTGSQELTGTFSETLRACWHCVSDSKSHRGESTEVGRHYKPGLSPTQSRWLNTCNMFCTPGSFPGGGRGKRTHLPMQVRPLGWEDPLKEGMATHSNTVACKIPWTEESGRLQSLGITKSRTE